jgi:rRNA maturation endonuclease Nob1
MAIVALVALAVLLGVLVMRSRGRRTPTQQASAAQQTMAPQIFCAKCGKENPASNEFCISCGNKLKSS